MYYSIGKFNLRSPSTVVVNDLSAIHVAVAGLSEHN
jgi:hypothetical protein